jgi:hypothetical protein
MRGRSLRASEVTDEIGSSSIEAGPTSCPTIVCFDHSEEIVLGRDRPEESCQSVEVQMSCRVDIKCPSCGKRGNVDLTSSGSHDNDDCDVSEMLAPEGFRKVQFGWSSDRLHLCCTTCGVASEYIVE